MHFLVDAQLPPALARWLAQQGHEATHVSDIDMAAASDRSIWQKAEEMDAVIVTKDEDFVSLASVQSSGPAVVWLRIGNTTRHTLLSHLAPVFPSIERTLYAGDRVVEVTPVGGTE